MSIRDKLQQSLATVSAAYEQGRTALNELVDEAAAVVSDVTGGRGRLSLAKVSEKGDATYVRLMLEEVSVGYVESRYPLAVYKIPPTGFPITVGDIDEKSRFIILEELASKDELQQHFEGLAGDPNSPLVLNALLIARRAAGRVV